ncbi:MAG TPA: glycerol-3-phosphate dehydrogenase [Verrucomicrobiota bacterium]|nr:glycerol-3-phosphate dehydrogenase [Verrucomicrobiota bacterium]
MSQVTIVGAGMMGTAMAWPLSDNGHQVRLVGTHLDREIIDSCLVQRFHPRLRRRLPDAVQPFHVDRLEEAVRGADVIVSGVSSPGVRWIGRALGPHIEPGMKMIAVTKGLEATADGDLRILPDVLAGEFPAGVRDKVSVAAIGGPCIAGELAGRRHTCVYFTSRNAAALPILRQMFRTSYYHVFLSTDIVGVEVCVALKNAYTLAVGLAEGMLERFGGPDEAGARNHNPAAALFGASAKEMARLVGILGGNPDKVASLPGVADEYVTCMGGRTVRLGRLLGKGLTYEQARAELAEETLESAFVVAQIAKALPALEARGLLGRDELPLTRCLCRVIAGRDPVEVEFDRLFTDDLR